MVSRTARVEIGDMSCDNNVLYEIGWQAIHKDWSFVEG